MDDIDTAAAPSLVRFIKRTQSFDVELGARIRATRNAAAMSQAALGAAVGLSFQQVQKYEMGNDRVSAATLFGFAAAMKVHVASFFESASRHEPARSGAGDDYSARIVVLFQRIDDPGIRKQFVALAAALAEGQAQVVAERADGNGA